MSNHPSQVNQLSKDDKRRHFPDGGKGDCIYRGRLGKEVNAERVSNFSKGYDKIDWSKT